MRTMFILFTFVCLTFQLMASTTKTQEIRGRIVDKTTGIPIEGATITVSESKTAIGTITDKNGEFHLWDVPSNMHLRISIDGYKVAYLDGTLISDSSVVVEMENNLKEKKKSFPGSILKNKKADTTNVVVFASE